MVRPRAQARPHLFDDRQLRFDGIRHPLLSIPAIVIDQKVTGYPCEPSVKAALGTAETLDRLENTEKHLLRQILRFAPAPGETEAQSIHLPRMEPDEVLPGALITAKAPCDHTLILARSS